MGATMTPLYGKVALVTGGAGGIGSAVCRELATHGDGLIVNVSSLAAVTAMGSNVMYCAAKAAVDNMTRSLARAGAGHPCRFGRARPVRHRIRQGPGPGVAR
jgi:NAD(P)-dependent dehydrogenase (short-subunit alcohol dehydrogenase family)